MLNPPNFGEIYENMNTNPRNSLTMLIKNGMNKQQKKFIYNIVIKLIVFFLFPSDDGEIGKNI